VSKPPTPDEARLAAQAAAVSAISEAIGPLTGESDTSDTSDRDSDGRLLAGARDGAWLTAQEFPPLTYAVDGLIPEGLTLEAGPPKAGKSWLTLGLLLSAASGGVALGRIKSPPPRRAFYLALEDGDRRMQGRCRALLGPGEAIPALFHYQTRIMPGAVVATITAWMRRHPDTALIVIDTLGKVMPPALQGESAYQRDYRIGAALKAIADDHPGLAITVLHHDRKAGAEDFVDSVSGTHGLAGAADTVIVLCRKRHSREGLLKVTGRDVPEAEYALKAVGDMAWQLDGADLPAAAATARKREAERALGETSAQILAVIREHPEGIRASDLKLRFGGDVYQYLKRLTEGGRIDKLERGLYVSPSEVSEVSESGRAEDTTRAARWQAPSAEDRAATLRQAGEDTARDAERQDVARAQPPKSRSRRAAQKSEEARPREQPPHSRHQGIHRREAVGRATR
jgi:hypothetical protein